MRKKTIYTRYEIETVPNREKYFQGYIFNQCSIQFSYKKLISEEDEEKKLQPGTIVERNKELIHIYSIVIIVYC